MRRSKLLFEAAVGLGFALLTGGLRIALLPWTGAGTPYALVFLSIVAAAVTCGWRSGLWAMLGGQVLTVIFIIGQPGRIWPLSSEEIASLLMATIAQFAIIAAIARYQAAIGRAAADAEVRIRDLAEKEAAVTASERQTTLVLDSVSDAFYAVDVNWRFILFNRAAEQYFSLARASVLGRKAWELFPDLPSTELIQRLQRVKESGVAETFVIRGAIKSERWIETRAAPTEGGGLAVSFSDVTERVRLEEARRLLVGELNHRVKNTLAIVQSLAQHSFGPEMRTGRGKAFEGRLLALARTHNLLTEANWDAPCLAEVVKASMLPFQQSERPTIEWHGAPVTITPKTAVTLSLGLHELATNALKYGALTSPAGHIGINWFIDEHGLVITWCEEGGPQVKKPGRKGFGSRLIERGLAAELDADVDLQFESAGLICTIRSRSSQAFKLC